MKHGRFVALVAARQQSSANVLVSDIDLFVEVRLWRSLVLKPVLCAFPFAGMPRRMFGGSWNV